MTPEQFTQFKHTLAEIQKLMEVCGSEYLDSIREMMTDEQYDEVRDHKAIDVLVI
ncbi:hypothetical protein [Candidatus Lokiarchaeum ossiferum]|uniref:hypothetical protein n=1 Tax=Candidatus Lokiarchaeum ossiferum TaxID=2951803 RepID=UPI00352F5779